MPLWGGPRRYPLFNIEITRDMPTETIIEMFVPALDRASWLGVLRKIRGL